MNCDNCGFPIADHCKIHLIPCCPGKCKGKSSPEQALESAFIGQHVKLLNDPFDRVYIFIGRDRNGEDFWVLTPHKEVPRGGPSFMRVPNERLDVTYYAPCCGG